MLIKKMNENLVREVIELFNEQEEKGIIEKGIENEFKITFAHFNLVPNSIKVEKFDSIRDITTGTLKYKINDLNINTKFVFKQKDSILALGEL